MLLGCHFDAIDLSSSHISGNRVPRPDANDGIPALSSSSEMPTISRPPSLYLTLSSSSFGNDFLQGSHQVAQKSTTATFPESEWSEMVPLPVSIFRVKSG